jgi:hypothetical protein
VKHHHALKQADDVLTRDGHAYTLPLPTRDTSAPCASARHCVSDPPSRVAYAGDVCAGCRGVRERMARELRARRR